MRFRNPLKKLVCTALAVISVNAVDHGLSRGGDEASHRTRQGFQPRPWFQSETVCRKNGSGENRAYKTRKIISSLWLLYEAMGVTNGVKGSCEEVCPCGDMGICISLPGDKATGSNQVATTYQCSCFDGTTSTGSSCTSSTGNAPEPCGGFSGTICSDKSMECIDDPRDSCDPKYGGADCLGICVPKCSTKTGKGCWEGFSCTLDPNTACIALAGFDCPGICAPTCAGSSELQVPCPKGTSCVDNPAIPDCLIAADCTGVCLAPPPCSVSTGEGCNDGFSCTYNPNIACIALVGVECPGICVPTCAGGRANNFDCPSGTYCVDNPATPGCVIAADCTGVCLPPSECDIESNEGCSDGFVCTIDNTFDCTTDGGSTCPGICAPSCTGGILRNIECPDGTECIDNPATPDCLIAADCTGVCAAPRS